MNRFAPNMRSSSAMMPADQGIIPNQGQPPAQAPAYGYYKVGYPQMTTEQANQMNMMQPGGMHTLEQRLTPEQSQQMMSQYFPNGIDPSRFQQSGNAYGHALQQMADPISQMSQRRAQQRMRNPQAAEAAFRARNNGGDLTARQQNRLDFLRNR